MLSRIYLPVGPFIGAVLLSGCVSGSGQKPLAVAPQAPARPVVPAAPVAPAPDPIAILIAQSDRHFEAGRKELVLGHLERAKAEFDRALDVVLESPDGARANSRLREHLN